MMISTIFKLCCLLPWITAASEDKLNRPNIILILADDLGWNDVSFHGSNQIPTPNIDALAYSGIILNNYYVQPICTPTRSALLTGRYPIHTGLQHVVIRGAQPYGLALDETIIPQYLNPKGYKSHIVGKWHLGFCSWEYTPTYRGFHSHYGYFLGEEDYWDHTSWAEGGKLKGLDFRHNKELIKDALGEYSTELFTRETEAIINKHNTSEPLFMYLPHQAVHSGNTVTPLEAPKKYTDKLGNIQNKKRRLFGGVVSALDDSIGNVTRALHKRGMLNNTIIIFSTDNGGPANGFQGNVASNWPLRGTKTQLWEGGVRGAGFAWSPLFKKQGYVSEQLMHVSDWLPTILHAAGVDTDTTTEKPIDGVDQFDTLSNNEASNRKEILLNIDPLDNTSAIRIGDYKVISGELYNGKWSGWYPPYKLPYGDPNTDTLNSLGSNDHDKDNKDNEFVVNMQQHKDDMEQFSDNTLEVNDNIQTGREPNDLAAILAQYTNTPAREPSPVVVKCGPKPSNASTNCKPAIAPCLYNLAVDPCEYNNIADSHPDILKQLLAKIAMYNATMVAPRNKPEDPAGFPSKHDWAWVPWLNLTDIDN
ncbi:unnamed protein product [Owenia fusiformis]|uniref:Uncharacterized protein n=1 Tax=Owenia fusiformis TaxID=6347 RepID=A0A8J1UIE3_OWEFU|nr:unnamed protein product [Owenia fusiformis]